MRWFCVAPDLPAKASLRIRTAPHSDADLCGRFSKGKAVAALSPIFEIDDDSGATNDCQRWLHVTFPDEVSGEWIQGFVMTELANGMVLLVPWEDAGFHMCCNITNDRALVYDGPEPTAQAIGHISDGEGTRFPYGVREVVGHRLRIFHDVHERVWVDAADVEPACERVDHPKCTVSHSFYTLNEELPPEAQIAVREFPSREAETRALLSRGQVIEVEMRCGSWLKIAGNPESWIMWRTDTWQLLTELPFHSSGSCALGDDVEMEVGEPGYAVDAGTADSTDPAQANGLSPENHDVEVMGASNQAASYAVEATATAQDTPNVVGSGTRKNSSSVTSLCDGLASNDISGHDDDTSADDSVTYRPEVSHGNHTVREPSAWDGRPLDVKSGAQHEQAEPLETAEIANSEVANDDSVRADVSSSWEDRPITKSSGVYEWQSEYSSPSKADDIGESDIAPEQLTDANAEMGASEEAINPTPESVPSWEDRPIGKSSGTYDWQSEYPSPSKADDIGDSDIAPEQSSDTNTEMEVAEDAVNLAPAVPSWEDRPIGKSSGTYDWQSEYPSPSKADDIGESDIAPEQLPDANAEMGASEEAINPTPVSVPSWEDRPIGKSSGTYDWQPEYPSPSKADDSGESETTPDQSSEANTVMEVTGEAVYATPVSVPSWEDRPITKSSGVYDWQSEYPSDVKTTSISETTTKSTFKDEQAEESTTLKSDPTPKEDLSGTGSTRGAGADVPWEDRPIASRHARQAALESHSPNDKNPLDDYDAKKALDDASSPWRVSRKTLTMEQNVSTPESASTSTKRSPKSSPIGIISTKGSVVWHSVDTTEDSDAFTGGDMIDDQLSSTPTPSRRSSNRVRHSPAPAVGVVSAHSASVAWHSSDNAEEPGVFDNVVDEAGNAVTMEIANDVCEATHERDATALPSNIAVPSTGHVNEDRAFGGTETKDHSGPEFDGEAQQFSAKEPTSVVVSSAEYSMKHQQSEDMEVDGDIVRDESPSFDAVPDNLLPSAQVVSKAERSAVEPDTALSVASNFPVARTDPRYYCARLVELQKSSMQSQSGANRILKAIALDEGSDAILEALATTGDFDEELLKYEPPASVRASIVPSPSTSESTLLDVLYSRDQDDGFSTPKKRRQPASMTTPSSPYTSESKETILAGILRRTPQKAATSHRKIIGNANPEDILEAEFGGCADELGLFGNYQYPTTGSTSQFSNGFMGASTRTVSAFGSLQAPSFSTSSFSSPPPKENPLKRSAAAIAKTPPVVLPKSVHVAQPAIPPAPKPVVQVPIPEPTPVSAPARPTPVLTTTVSASRLPPSVRTPTALPRPSLVAPSTMTSRLRGPSVGGPPSPSPIASRARSFTTNNDTRPSSSPAPTPTIPASGLARTQSLLPRKSALQAPSPIKFGITRTNSLAASTATPSSGDTGADPRRLSFGFSRSAIPKKQ